MNDNYIEFFIDNDERPTVTIHKNGRSRTIKNRNNIRKLLSICEKYGYEITEECIIKDRVLSIAHDYEEYINKKNSLKVVGEIKPNMKVSRKSKVGKIAISALALAAITTLAITNINKGEVVNHPDDFVKGIEATTEEEIDDYIKYGSEVEGYDDIEKLLYQIRDNTPGIEYLYVIKIEEDGCHVSFDLSTPDEPALPHGHVIEFEEAFMQYLPDLFAGREIEPIESNDISGWVITVYYPLKNDKGECVSYVGADISMMDVRAYVKDLMLRLVLISSSFLVISLAFGKWLSNNFHQVDDLQLLIDKRDQDKLLIREIVEAFAKVIDMKDRYTRGHSARVAKYTAMLTKELGYDDETVDRYYNIALLHDIGKVAVPEEILNKPGKLTDEEFAKIKSHSQLGYNVLKGISIMPELATGAGSHHERPDGKGYPNGLKQGEIPRVAQIIAVADTFDAMYSDRPYRKRMNFEKAVSIIQEVSGTQLFPDVVDAFTRLVNKGYFRAPDDDGGGTTETIENIRK